uniref:AC117-like protein n=1 Tax=Melanchra picta nucleopolyhedrovirus TaxID=2975247 RepID=A0AA49CJ44_NPVMC|nr:AC117-like protein [Melanchra picta nucleopolyhedrovirus]
MFPVPQRSRCSRPATMKRITFVLAIFNRDNLDQQAIYEEYLRHFDVIDAVMCLNGDCLAVCVSSVDAFDRPRSFVDFRCDKRRRTISVVDRHEDVEVLLDRVYDIAQQFDETL